ncbi:MAG: hypothetical protein ACUVX8_14065 [Candidatus Zipacnadales bacterium]
MPSSLLCGAAKLEITPPLHIPYLGFEPRQGTFKGIHDPLFARAAVFSNQGAHVAVLSVDALGLSNDLLGPGREFIAEIRERVASQTELLPESILLAATHAHSTPETYGITRLWEREDCVAWIETLASQLVSVLILSWRDRRPARVFRGQTRLAGISHNRRDTAGPLDEDCIILVADREGGGPVILANFACHPVTVQVNPLISADFPGAAVALVERQMDGHCLFLQGAAGDINPIHGHTGDWRDVEAYGLMLGGAILETMGAARLYNPVETPVVGADCKVLHLEAREAPTLEEATIALEEAESNFCDIAEDHPKYPVYRSTLRRAQELYRLAQFGTDPVPLEVQVLRIGDLGLAAFAGELFCELGLRVKRESSAPVTMIVECANGCVGYLAPRQAWVDGGYEVSLGAWCRVAAGGPERATEAAIQLLANLFRT